jgi:hypothetical protein
MSEDSFPYRFQRGQIREDLSSKTSRLVTLLESRTRTDAGMKKDVWGRDKVGWVSESLLTGGVFWVDEDKLGDALNAMEVIAWMAS